MKSTRFQVEEHHGAPALALPVASDTMPKRAPRSRAKLWSLDSSLFLQSPLCTILPPLHRSQPESGQGWSRPQGDWEALAVSLTRGASGPTGPATSPCDLRGERTAAARQVGDNKTATSVSWTPILATSPSLCNLTTPSPSFRAFVRRPPLEQSAAPQARWGPGGCEPRCCSAG